MLYRFKKLEELYKHENFPKCIEKIVIHDGVNLDAEAYNYDIINIENGKKYWGWHKISDNPNEWYFESCKDEEFRKLWAGDKPIFRYEVISSGESYIEDHYESVRLQEAKATQSSDYYNGNNGMKRTSSSKRQSLAEKVKDEIANFDKVEIWTKGMFENHRWIQTRKQNLFLDHASKIKATFDKNPSTSKFPPLVCLENYYGTGIHAFIGGKHTFTPWMKHEKTIDIKVKVIPYEMWKSLDYRGVKLLGNLLNDRTEEPKENSKPEDFVDEIYDSYLDLKEERNGQRLDNWWNFYDWTSFLERRGLFPKGIQAAKRMVTKMIEDSKVKPGMEFKQYSDEEKEEFIENLKKDYPNWTVQGYSTGVPVYERLQLLDIDDNGKAKNKNLIFVPFHSTYSDYEAWPDKREKIKSLNNYHNQGITDLEDELKRDLSDKKINLHFEEPKHLFPKVSHQISS